MSHSSCYAGPNCGAIQLYQQALLLSFTLDCMHLFHGSGWWQEPWSMDIALWRHVLRFPRGLCSHSPSVELERAQGQRRGAEMKQHLEWLFWSSVPLLEVTSCLNLQLAEGGKERESVQRHPLLIFNVLLCRKLTLWWPLQSPYSHLCSAWVCNDMLIVSFRSFII